MSVLRVPGSSSSFSSAGRAEWLQSPGLSLPSWVSHTPGVPQPGQHCVRWLWLISQPACQCREVAASALNAGWALGSNLGSQLKSSLSGMPSLGTPGLPGRAEDVLCHVPCVSWSVYSWTAPFLAELASSSLIKHWFSSLGKGGVVTCGLEGKKVATVPKEVCDTAVPTQGPERNSFFFFKRETL